MLETAKAQYKQMRRWSHWVQDIPYVFFQRIEKRQIVPFWRTLYEFLRLAEWMILWATLHTLLFAWLIITLIKDTYLNSFTTLGKTISFFSSISIILLIFAVFMQILFVPWNLINWYIKKIYEITKFTTLFVFFIWPSLIIFAGLPALHTQIAILLWKPMKKFNVTIKVRKNEN